MKTRKQTFFVVSLISLITFQSFSQTFEERVPRDRERFDPVPKPIAPNEIRGQKGNYRGVVVQMIKSRAPWQLINPFAPASYGSGTYNMTTDPSTGEVDGLKLFSFEF